MTPRPVTSAQGLLVAVGKDGRLLCSCGRSREKVMQTRDCHIPFCREPGARALTAQSVRVLTSSAMFTRGGKVEGACPASCCSASSQERRARRRARRRRSHYQARRKAIAGGAHWLTSLLPASQTFSPPLLGRDRISDSSRTCFQQVLESGPRLGSSPLKPPKRKNIYEASLTGSDPTFIQLPAVFGRAVAPTPHSLGWWDF